MNPQSLTSRWNRLLPHLWSVPFVSACVSSNFSLKSACILIASITLLYVLYLKFCHFERKLAQSHEDKKITTTKGYSLCKIITLGQKVKFKKTCQNPFYKSFRVVVCKKPLQKNTKYSRNETILKIGHHAKAITFAKSSLWVKN